MINEYESDIMVEIDEDHIYKVDIDNQPIIKWSEGSISIRIHIPYDILLRHNGAYLSKISNNQDIFIIGRIILEFSDQSRSSIPLTIPTDPELLDHIKSGRQIMIKRKAHIVQPRDTLVVVHGDVLDFDGADGKTDQLQISAPESIDSFTNDLRLRLMFWVPDLLVPVKQSRASELHEMLLQREHIGQIFLPSLEDLDLLAQSLAGLANRSGGRVLIGVEKTGQVVGVNTTDPTFDDQMTSALLVAALHCDPPVRFSAPVLREDADGRIVMCVNVPRDDQKDHAIDGVIYVRERTGFAIKSAQEPDNMPMLDTSRALNNLEDLLEGNSKDVIVLDARDIPLTKLEIGPSICSLINANQRDGLILIRGLTPSARRSFFDLWDNGALGIVRRATARLQNELSHIVPRLSAPRIQIVNVNEEMVVVLGIPNTHKPVALYDGMGYEWDGHVRKQLATKEVFARYLKCMDADHEDQIDADQVTLVHGWLAWPIRPPAHQTKQPHYDVQRQAMVWDSRLFSKKEHIAGRDCMLTAPLRHMLVADGERGLAVRRTSLLEGGVLVRFDNMLVSGTRVIPTMIDSLFGKPVVSQRTNVRLQLTIDAQQLFRRRKRMTSLRFQMLDVAIDDDRITDLQQACADLGFRDFKIQRPDRTDGAEEQVVFKAVRSKGFCDISLYAKIISKYTPLSRELRYPQRTDSKTTHTALLDVRFELMSQGEGAQAAQEIAEVQVSLYRVLSQRLRYLRIE